MFFFFEAFVSEVRYASGIFPGIKFSCFEGPQGVVFSDLGARGGKRGRSAKKNFKLNIFNFVHA